MKAGLLVAVVNREGLVVGFEVDSLWQFLLWVRQLGVTLEHVGPAHRSRCGGPGGELGAEVDSGGESSDESTSRLCAAREETTDASEHALRESDGGQE